MFADGGGGQRPDIRVVVAGIEGGNAVTQGWDLSRKNKKSRNAGGLHTRNMFRTIGIHAMYIYGQRSVTLER